MLTIDLNAPTIPSSRRVWRLFPGAGYRFLEIFESKGVGFLDIPGFPFPSGSLSEANDLIPRIAAQQAASKQAMDDDVDEVEADPTKHLKARNTKARGRTRRSIINFYEKAEANDLVVVPSPGNLSQISIGRFQGNKKRNIPYEVKDWTFEVAVRDIEWLTKVRENMVSSELSESLRNQHAFTVLAESLHVEFYALAYPSFTLGDKSVSSVTNRTDYLDSDFSLLGLVSRLAAAACYAIDNNMEGLGPRSDIEILLNTPPSGYSCSHEIDIHSPGFNRYVSDTRVSLVIVSVLAAMIALGDANAAKAQTAISQISVINTAPDADPTCNPPIAEATKRILEHYPIATTIKACQDALEAQKRAGLDRVRKRRVAERIDESEICRLHQASAIHSVRWRSAWNSARALVALRSASTRRWR